MSDHMKNGVFYLAKGSKGNAVEFVQKQLGIEDDGDFGGGTKTAVEKFQSANGLGKDGIVGVSTMTRLAKKNIHLHFSRTKKTLILYIDGLATYGIDRLLTCRAISGLPAGHPRVRQLIGKGRDDLDLETNYMLPGYDGVSDAGPIPDGSYELPLRPGMAYQKTDGGWGVGGWFLDPGNLSRLGYRLGLSRGGFFLHHDGNGEGTGGCIGVSEGKFIKMLKNIFTQQQKNFGNIKLAVKVV